MKFKTVDKSQFNVRLSHFLLNGLDIISAQLGMNRSEVMRLSLYNLLKDTYDKKDLDIFAGRDDVVEEWVEFLKEPGRSGEFISQRLANENKKDELDEYQELYDEELEKRLKPIKKKYGVPYAEDFLRKTGMTEKEASEYFKNYFKTAQNQAHEYMKEIQEYLENEYPKERKEIEAKLKQLTGKSWDEMRLKALVKHIDYMIKYHQEGVEAYADGDQERFKFEKKQLKKWKEKKKEHEENEKKKK